MMINILGGKIFILIAAIWFSSAHQNTQEQADQARLAAILKKSEDYCRRLENAALDFVCFEEVTEASRYYASNTDAYVYDYQFNRMEVSRYDTPQKDVYLYDYQFIRKDMETKEKRNLIAVNGKKTNIQDSSLNTVMFQYKNVLFGPVGLLSKSWQAYLDYRLIGEDTINKERAVVIEATPGPALNEPHCYGKIWVKEDDGSVLKIVWDQKSLGNFQSVEEWAKVHDAEPQITAFSEYGFEKNGLRFPSRNYTENAHIKKDKQKFVNAEISIRYKNYKFFTVETEIKY
jgi:outer membrane lipoprotein-sorting protein